MSLAIALRITPAPQSLLCLQFLPALNLLIPDDAGFNHKSSSVQHAYAELVLSLESHFRTSSLF